MSCLKSLNLLKFLLFNIFVSFSTKYIARRYTSNNDIVVGTPIYKTVSDGLINKVVPLQTNVKPQISFKDFFFKLKTHNRCL